MSRNMYLEELPVANCHGIYRRKYHLRALFQSSLFLMLVVGYSLYNGYVQNSTLSVVKTQHRRQLQEAKSLFPFRHKEQFFTTLNSVSAKVPTMIEHSRDLVEECNNLIDPAWFIVWYVVGVLYMFLALAIVCDEFFVPALEEMSCERHLNLSMDVAGATLMAAGGSAPELFTSLIGTFKETEVGIGTIVGSAVFNVLFVIAMCSLLAKETLELTWWPLFRDSFYYAVGLIVLAMFIGVVSKNKIELWEAIVLLGMYAGYILLMAFNRDIYKAITGKELVMPGEEDEDKVSTENTEHKNDENSETERSKGNGEDLRKSVIRHAHFRWQGTFRAGILKLIRDPENWVETAGNGIVARIAGDVDTVFKQVDVDGSGEIDKEELSMLFLKLECELSPSELDHVFESLDEDKSGTISKLEFTRWYGASEERIISQAKHIFESYDKDNSKTIDKDELKEMVQHLDSRATDEDIAEVMEVVCKSGDPSEITYEEFAEWYKSSILFEKKVHDAEEDAQGVWENLRPPRKGGCFAWTWYLLLLPLVLFMTCTIPDVRVPGRGRWCYLAFVLSIAHIGGYSYLMVWWAETIGNSIGIPSVILGLTILAAGTSVPDLLSSVIVARRGSGDMAVSSSIGSNIFDILVGLPLPWILYTAWPDTPSTVKIESDNIAISISILIGMLIFVIAAVHCQGWKLTKTLAGLMLLFYFGFLVQAIVLEMPFETCV